MRKQTFSWPSLAMGGLLIVLIGALALTQGWLQPVSAQSKATPVPASAAKVEPSGSDAILPRTITVVGEGSVKIQPDIARANIGVETFGATVKVATSQAAATMDAVLTALKSQGIAEKDIQTTGYSVWVERNSGSDGNTSDKVVYHVNNNVSVTIRDLAKVGAVLDAAIEAGANSIYGVSFSVAEPEKLEAEARGKAIANALAKAKELAQLNGVEVGAVVSVSEVVGAGGGSYDSNFMRLSAEKAAYSGGGAGSVSPGELELALRLQVVYQIQ